MLKLFGPLDMKSVMERILEWKEMRVSPDCGLTILLWKILQK